MKRVLFLSILAITLFASCKKDSEDEETSIKGKWTVQNIITKEYVNNVLTTTDDEPGEGTTLDFQENGDVIITNPSGTKTFPYTLTGSNISFEGDTHQIRDLSKTAVTLYLKEDFGGGYYYEFFINLKR